jgi:tetratricopeptide (TPR) repeat protein
MKCICLICCTVLWLMDGLLAFSQDPIRWGRPISPEVMAKQAEVNALRDQAKALIKAGRPSEAVPILESAATLEDSPPLVFGSTAKYELAKLLTNLGREPEALAVYRRAFKWDPNRGDLTINGPPALQISMDYAILLARSGKAEEAKAIYYWGLRLLNRIQTRHTEVVPLLVVFDPEPEGVFWEYSPQRLEAVAAMLKGTNGGTFEEHKNSLRRARELAPDWFFPVLWQSAQTWSTERGAQLLLQAEALARPGLEQQLVQRYKEELAEHRAYLDAADLVPTHDARPMTEGAARRSRMACLVPNQEVLRRVSVGWPGG